MTSKTVNSKSYSITDLGNELDTVVLEQLILDSDKNIEAVKVEWSTSEMIIWYRGKDLKIAEINQLLSSLGIKASSRSNEGPNGVISLSTPGYLRINRKSLKIWISAIGFALGCLILVSAFSDYRENSGSLKWGFLNIYYIPSHLSYLTGMMTFTIGLIAGIFRFYLGIDKVLLFDHLTEKGPRVKLSEVSSNVLLNSIGRYIILSIIALLVVFIGQYLNDFHSIFFVSLLILATGLTMSGAWRSKNPVARYNYIIGTILRDIRIRNRFLSEILKGTISAFKVGPISLMIWSALLLSADYINALIVVGLVELGSMFMTMILNYLTVKYKYDTNLASTYWYKVYGLLFIFISLAVINDYFAFMGLPYLSAIGDLGDLWKFTAFTSALFIFVRSLFENAWIILFKPFSLYRFSRIFLMILYIGVVVELLIKGGTF